MGKEKYHVCVYVGTDGEVHRFLYLNSRDHYEQCFAVPCTDIPCLPESQTGLSVFSFAEAPKFTDGQLKTFKARHIGRLSSEVAMRAYAAAETTTLLSRKDKLMVLSGLATITDGDEEL